MKTSKTNKAKIDLTNKIFLHNLEIKEIDYGVLDGNLDRVIADLTEYKTDFENDGWSNIRLSVDKVSEMWTDDTTIEVKFYGSRLETDLEFDRRKRTNETMRIANEKRAAAKAIRDAEKLKRKEENDYKLFLELKNKYEDVDTK